MNVSSGAHPDGTNEFELAGLELGLPVAGRSPFVAESPAAFECRTVSVDALVDMNKMRLDRYPVIGRAVRTHIGKDYIRNGQFDTEAGQPIARLGYRDYSTVDRL